MQFISSNFYMPMPKNVLHFQNWNPWSILLDKFSWKNSEKFFNIQITSLLKIMKIAFFH